MLSGCYQGNIRNSPSRHSKTLQNRNSTLVKRRSYASTQENLKFLFCILKTTINNCTFLASKKSSIMSSFPHWPCTSVKVLAQRPSNSNGLKCPKTSLAAREWGLGTRMDHFHARGGGDILVHCLCETSVIVGRSICSSL